MWKVPPLLSDLKSKEHDSMVMNLWLTWYKLALMYRLIYVFKQRLYSFSLWWSPYTSAVLKRTQMLYMRTEVARIGGSKTRSVTIGYFYKTEHPSAGRKSVFTIWFLGFFFLHCRGLWGFRTAVPPSSLIPPLSPFLSLSCILLRCLTMATLSA